MNGDKRQIRSKKGDCGRIVANNWPLSLRCFSTAAAESRARESSIIQLVFLPRGALFGLARHDAAIPQLRIHAALSSARMIRKSRLPVQIIRLSKPKGFNSVLISLVPGANAYNLVCASKNVCVIGSGNCPSAGKRRRQESKCSLHYEGYKRNVCRIILQSHAIVFVRPFFRCADSIEILQANQVSRRTRGSFRSLCRRPQFLLPG
jgi:hypothetical protein